MFLSQAANLRGDSGTPLPDVYPTLAQNDIRFYRASTVMVAAGPSTGKSMFALNYALDAGCKTLYISPDTSKGDTVVRAGQRLTGNLRAVVEAQLNEGPDVYPHLYEKLDSVRNIDFNFRTGIDLDDIRNMIFAYCEKTGEWPELIIIDNLVNLIVDQSNPAEWQMTTQDLDDIAKETEACVMILTHVAGHKENGTDPIGLSDILYKVTKYAATVLTLTEDAFDRSKMLVACVKNRNGKMNKNGTMRYELRIRRETCHIWDPLNRQAPPVDSVNIPSDMMGVGLEPTSIVQDTPAQPQYAYQQNGYHQETPPNLDRIRAFMAVQDTS